MKGLIAVAALGLGLAVGSCGSSSGSDPKALCMQEVQKTCDLLYDCAEGAAIRALFPGEFPATKADCQAASAQCTAMACGTGETYHADQDAMCASKLNALTCASLSDPNLAFPAACEMICSTN